MPQLQHRPKAKKSMGLLECIQTNRPLHHNIAPVLHIPLTFHPAQASLQTYNYPEACSTTCTPGQHQTLTLEEVFPSVYSGTFGEEGEADLAVETGERQKVKGRIMNSL
jgi:hypothetical protein